jgi:hypothetical protein
MGSKYVRIVNKSALDRGSRRRDCLSERKYKSSMVNPLLLADSQAKLLERFSEGWV